MEQGDHVTKSPWSNWQFGVNEFYSDWHGHFKGRGDKKVKYPYNDVYERGGLYERAVNPTSSKYSLLGKNSKVNSSLNSNRNGIASDSYGLVGVRPLLEPTVGFNVSAAIRPKQVTKGAITIADKTPATIAQPQAISFKAPDIQITPPEAPTVTANTPNISLSPITAPSVTEPELPKPISFEMASPTIVVPTLVAPTFTLPTPPSTGNGDGEWITDQGSVGILHQQNLRGGQLDMVETGHHFDLTATNVDMTGEKGNHQTYPHGLQNWTYQSNDSGGWSDSYAAMKLVGGQEINIDGVTIDYSGTGDGTYRKWLFHTDGHNNFGDSTWVLENGTVVNMTGQKLVMYTAQYHGGTNQHANIGFVNKGQINLKGSENYGWITMTDGSDTARVMYFHNNGGTIDVSGNKNVFAVMGSEPTTAGGFSWINDGDMILSGTNAIGMAFDTRNRQGRATGNEKCRYLYKFRINYKNRCPSKKYC